jgi:hypothetical protein
LGGVQRIDEIAGLLPGQRSDSGEAMELIYIGIELWGTHAATASQGV